LSEWRNDIPLGQLPAPVDVFRTHDDIPGVREVEICRFGSQIVA
jgi:hypothetical protein